MAVVCFEKTKVVITHAQIEIWPKFRLQIDFDLRRIVSSPNPKLEVHLQRHSRHLECGMTS